MSIGEFLVRTDLPPGALGYHQLQGFLFALAAAPEMVPPSEWMPVVFGGKLPKFDTTQEAREVLDSLMELYNEVNRDVFERAGRLPSDCRFRDDALSNLDRDAPISQWSLGLMGGHTWLEESWDEYVPQELRDELAAMLLMLSFFASRRIAEAALAERSKPEMTLSEMAEFMRKSLPGAAAAYARLGRSIHQALLKHPPAEAGKVGRNEPCPCGSGKKYKRCCGASS